MVFVVIIARPPSEKKRTNRIFLPVFGHAGKKGGGHPWTSVSRNTISLFRLTPVPLPWCGICCGLSLWGAPSAPWGQVLRNLYERLGLSGDDAGTAVSVTLIFLSALLTGLGLFDKLAKHAGAGTLVPITGFGQRHVSPALEFKSEGYITGTAAKLFVVAGPVLVFGISASVIYGLICFFFGL